MEKQIKENEINIGEHLKDEVHSEASGSHSEHTLFSERIPGLGDVPITNSLINSWVVVLILIGIGFALRKKNKLVPKGAQNVFEMLLDAFLKLIDSTTGDRKKSYLLLPIVFTFFIFILFNNWLGIMPGVGSIGALVSENGHSVFVPYFRGGTADINTTLALAITGVFISHILGIMALGAWSYFNKFVNIRALLEIPKKIRSNPTIAIVNPINVLIGLIEIVGEIAKVASLSFRLFGNIYAGEVLLASMAALFAFGVPIPFIFLEILIGIIQAFVFAMLVLSYISMAITSHEH